MQGEENAGGHAQTGTAVEQAGTATVTALRREEWDRLASQAAKAAIVSDPTALAILFVLRDGPRSISQLEEGLGYSRPCLEAMTRRFGQRGIIQGQGASFSLTTWGVSCFRFACESTPAS
jgi:Bacterial regulatory protein, arsR family